MSYIDTHAHIYREYYPETLEAVINRALEADVPQIILPCVNATTVDDLFAVSNQFPDNLFPLIGLHPSDVTDNFKIQLHELENHIDDSGIVGIGEIGMDLYTSNDFLEEQKIAFDTQLHWALESHLPLSIHIRNAYNPALSILKSFKGTPFSGVLHCFSGGIQEAKWAVDNGFMLGISGIITFKKNKLQDLVKEIGIQHLVLETDAPYLAPEPYRGKINESSYIPFIAEKLSQIFDMHIDDVKNITTQNAYSIFKTLSK